MMDIQYENVLRKLYTHAKEAREYYVMNCDIGLFSDKRKEVCHWLQNNGYISKYEAIGKTYVRCQITEKAIQYFNNKAMEEEK